MRPLLAVLVAFTVAVAGCATEEKDDQDQTGSSGDPAVNNTTSAPVVFTGEGQVTAGAAGASLASGGVEFTVQSGAKLLFAELAWDDEVQDLDLSLSSPAARSAAGETNFDHTAQGGMPGAPNSPHSLTLESPEAGDWIGGASPNGASGTVAYRIAVTVFYEETAVPEGYSAL